MKKIFLLALVFAVSVSMVFAAVYAEADGIALGPIESGSGVGGLFLNGSASVESMGDRQVFSIPETSSVSFEGVAGETLKITAPADENGEFSLSITAGDNTDILVGALNDSGEMYAEYVLPADGTYLLSNPEGTLNIYSIIVE